MTHSWLLKMVGKTCIHKHGKVTYKILNVNPNFGLILINKDIKRVKHYSHSYSKFGINWDSANLYIFETDFTILEL